jgi:hypothetical protein
VEVVADHLMVCFGKQRPHNGMATGTEEGIVATQFNPNGLPNFGSHFNVTP